MGIRRRSLSFVLAMMTAILAGCGGVSTKVQNPPPPAQSNIAIALKAAPTSPLQISGTTSAAATVSNDPTNLGVDWILTCGGVQCGSLSSPHSASGQAVTYTAPATLSGNNLVVNLLAFATADHTKNVATTITIFIPTFTGFLKSGTYVVETKGSDASGSPYQRAGVIMLDGKGVVTGGKQTVNFVNPTTFAPSSVTDTVTGGSYFIGSDGRGTLTLNTTDLDIGQQGIETFNLTILSNSHALVVKFDNSTLAGSNETSVGTLDLQNPQTSAIVPAKGYAFVANGTDISFSELAIGGVFNIDSSQTISGTGSVFDAAYPAITGSGVVTSSSSLSGIVSTPDSFGVFKVTLATDFGSIQLTAYPLGDGTHLKLIESDGAIGLTVGDAYSQGSATGTFTTQSTFTGSYVFGISGRDSGGSPASLAAAGLFSTSGGGRLTNGYIDESQLSIPLQISDGFSAAYAVGPGSDPTVTFDPNGIGRFYIPLSSTTGLQNFTFSNPSNGTGPAWVFYLSGNGGPALMLDADIEPTFASGLLTGGGVGTGIAYPVVAGASFSGSYGTIFTPNMVGTEFDIAGEIAATGSALSGILDITNATGPQSPATGDTSLSGSYQTSTINNRLTGTLSDDFFFSNLGSGTTSPLSMAFYPIDSTQGVFVENDLADSTGTPITGDITFGYYAARTPVCQGCK